MKVWASGKIVDGAVPIDSLNFSLHYANPASWEGIRSYLQPDGSTKIFKLRDHVERLVSSARIIGFEIPFSMDEIEQGCKDVVEANGGGDLYLRPIAYAEYEAETVRAKPKVIALDIYCFKVGPLHQKGDGIKMAISNIVRGYPQYQMQAKTPSNYASLQIALNQMKSQGIDDVFVMDNHGYIVEATVANVFVVHGDVISTPPNDGSILPGVTRRVLARILQDEEKMLQHGKFPKVVEKRITRADLYTADCVMLCGTFAEVVRVDEIDGRKLKGSPYYEILKKEYAKVTRGS